MHIGFILDPSGVGVYTPILMEQEVKSLPFGIRRGSQTDQRFQTERTKRRLVRQNEVSLSPYLNHTRRNWDFFYLWEYDSKIVQVNQKTSEPQRRPQSGTSYPTRGRQGDRRDREGRSCTLSLRRKEFGPSVCCYAHVPKSKVRDTTGLVQLTTPKSSSLPQSSTKGLYGQMCNGGQNRRISCLPKRYRD